MRARPGPILPRAAPPSLTRRPQLHRPHVRGALCAHPCPCDCPRPPSAPSDLPRGATWRAESPWRCPARRRSASRSGHTPGQGPSLLACPPRAPSKQQCPRLTGRTRFSGAARLPPRHARCWHGLVCRPPAGPAPAADYSAASIVAGGNVQLGVGMRQVFVGRRAVGNPPATLAGGRWVDAGRAGPPPPCTRVCGCEKTRCALVNWWGHDFSCKSSNSGLPAPRCPSISAPDRGAQFDVPGLLRSGCVLCSGQALRAFCEVLRVKKSAQHFMRAAATATAGADCNSRSRRR